MSSSDSSFSVRTISVPVRAVQSQNFRVFTFFLLLLSSSLGGGSGTTGSSTANGSGGSTTAGADVGQEVLDVLALKSLKKKKSQRKRLSRSRGPFHYHIRLLRKGGPVFTLAKREVQMGSTSATLAAPMRVWIFSAYNRRKTMYQPSSLFAMQFRCDSEFSSSFRAILPQLFLLIPCRRFSRDSWTNTYGDLDAIIGEDEGGVGASELGSRHGGRRVGLDWESREGWG